MRWLKHDTDANQDAKLQNVLLDYGLEGYGLYWYCLELIAGKVDKDNITFELEHDARIIARNTGCTPQKVEEMMRYFVELGLFESSEGVITCLKLARRLDSSMTSNTDMRNIIQKLKNPDGVMTKSDKVMQDKKRIEEKRIDKKTSRFTPPSFKEVSDYCIERNNRVNPQAFLDHYESNGWMRGKTKIKDWKACVRTWEQNNKDRQPSAAPKQNGFDTGFEQ
jgi:hypothetical protein